MNLEGYEISSTALITCLLILYALFLFCRKIFINHVIRIEANTKHNWKCIKILDRACYCNVCEVLLTASTGVFCDYCGICVHSSKACMKVIGKQFKCKTKWLKNCESIVHLWVKGNLPLNSVCSRCNDEVDGVGLHGWRCAWCQRCYHNNCYKQLDGKDLCDFGEFADMIYPPYSIVAARTRKSMRLHLVEIKKPQIEGWQPLIVIVNTKSGGNSDLNIISLIRGILHPLQIMELNARGTHDIVEWLMKTSPIPCRILIAGGDGSIGWVLNTIHTRNVKPTPSVAILPLGTGNDLSRVLGWGSEPSSLDPIEILRKIRKANSIKLDRFDLEIERIQHRLTMHRNTIKTLHLYSYLSIGVDALVTYNFHKTRESPFYILSNRIFNKLIYFGFGTQQVVQRDCEGLEQKVELYLDRKLVELPELQSIVFMNIDSWGAGCNLCELSNAQEMPRIVNSFSDGVLEVFGILSSFHIAQLKVGISKPFRLGQARNVELLIKANCPMQADGEPWIQPPGRLILQSHSQASMLKAI